MCQCALVIRSLWLVSGSAWCTTAANDNTLIRSLCCGGQRLVQIPQDIVDIFQTDAQTDKVGSDAGGEHLVFVELAVRGGDRVDGQALGVAYIGKMAQELEVVDKLFAGLDSSFDAKTEDGAVALGQIFLGPFVVGVVLEARVHHPTDSLVFGEIFCYPLCVGAMAIHAQAQRLDPLQRGPTVEGGLAGADVAQNLHARLDGEGRQTHPRHIGISRRRQ